jgi:hypothetical protein
MSSRKALWTLAAAVCLAAPVAARAQGDYLDVFVVKVKPEKVSEYQANGKKYAKANRRANGDRWIAFESVYGESNVVMYVSTRNEYADIDKALDAEMAALEKTYGKAATQKLQQDLNNSVVWTRAELRRRRWDLSRKAPQSAEEYAKLIGESRLLRTTAVHIRPGRTPEFEALLKEVKEAGEKNPNTAPVFVSQVIEGGEGGTFYLSTLRSSIGGFDHNPTTKDILGDEAFKKLQKIVAETYESSQSVLYRINPELSNPPEEVAKVAMDFWHPKAMVAAAGKAKAATDAAAPKGVTKKQ